MTKILLKTLGSFYYEIMIASAPSDFTEMVSMGMRLEEGIREGRLVKEGSSSSSIKKFGSVFPKRKEQDVSVIFPGRPRRGYSHVAVVTPAVRLTMVTPTHQTPPIQQWPFQQQPRQQAYQFNNQNRSPRKLKFDAIPMTYTELFPSLIRKNLITTKPPPVAPNSASPWYKADQLCEYHQGSPGHNIENCYHAVEQSLDHRRHRIPVDREHQGDYIRLSEPALDRHDVLGHRGILRSTV